MVATVRVASVWWAGMVTLVVPSSSGATKSLPAFSATVTVTTVSAAGAGVAVTVKVADSPSVI